ncbi:MAG: glycosyltransferase [Chloroflexia bacterium]|nr:glycosyltransferase [Chloroflexia bacterium]
MRRICYAGTYERDYPRNRLTVRALRHAGLRVEEAHLPVFEHLRDKSGLSPFVLAGFAIRLLFAYLRLIPNVMLRLLRCDLLVVGYIGQLDMLVLGTLARLMRKPVVFNPLVSLTDTLVEDRGKFRAGSVPGRLVHLVDRLSMRMADLVLADTRENAGFFATQFGLDQQRIAVVQVGAPEEMFYPGAAEVGDVLDVLFVGKFIPLHGIETILRAAALLERQGVDARIELVGTGQDYAAARVLADELGLRSIVWTDWIPFDQLGTRLREADVALGIFDDGAKAARVIPNKVHQALASGTAVVTRTSPAIEGFLSDGETALLVPPADPLALAGAIQRLGDSGERQRIAEAGHRSWLEWGSQRALADQLTLALERLDSRA